MSLPLVPSRIGFVCFASAQVGGGHVMRCLTLAAEMERRGSTVYLAVNPEARHFVPALDRTKFLMVASPDAWTESLDVIIFDSYDIDARMERRFRAKANHIVVIDDLANRAHDCDVLIDSGMGRTAADYRYLVPPHALVLAGPAYLLLRPEFVTRHKAASARHRSGGQFFRTLVSFGLTDVGGITARVVDRLLSTDQASYLDVVIGPSAPSREFLESRMAGDPRLTLVIDPADMAQLMERADLAIGAGGQTSWERCCLGVPTLLMVLADNQRSGAVALDRAGAVVVVDGTSDAHLGEMASLYARLVADAEWRARMSAAAARLVDGKGCVRIGQILLGLITGTLPQGESQ
jgi:UDP-2,4-diacetamido-2,4,6-trideoxy-beta-L-altropyranose hydrolase